MNCRPLFIIVALFGINSVFAQTPLYRYGGAIPVGNDPRSVATGDFNLDGKQDLAVASFTGTLTVLLGDGTGSFSPAPGGPLNAGAQPLFMVSADFNNDSRPDLAVLSGSELFNNLPSGAVRIFLGDGPGHFNLAPSSPIKVNLLTSSQEGKILLGDFNRDGITDLLVGGGFVTNRLIGDGHGGFAAFPGPTPLSDPAVSFAIADIDQDGFLDFISGLAAGSGLYIQNGDAAGNLRSSRTSAADGGNLDGPPRWIVPTDVDRDGLPDLLTLGRGGYISTWRNQGPPFYLPEVVDFVPSGSGAARIESIDLNADGKPDWAATLISTGEITVRLGDGTGKSLAAPGSPFAVGGAPFNLQFADFDGDGRPDIAAVSPSTGEVRLLLSSAGSNPGKKAQSITFDPLAQFIPFSPDPLELHATASSGLPVSFASQTPSVCSVSGAQARTLSLGQCIVTASQAGDASYEAATSVTAWFTIQKGNQTFSLPTIADRPLGSPAFPVSATASSGLPVTISSRTGLVCTVAGNVVTLIAAGTCMLSFNQAGNENYFNVSVGLDFRVLSTSGQSQTIRASVPAAMPYTFSGFILDASATSGLAIAVVTNTPGICTANGPFITLVTVGTCSLTISQPGNATFQSAPPLTISFLVQRAPQTISFPPIGTVQFGNFVGLLNASSVGLPIVYTVFAGPATVSGSLISLTGLGSVTIQASQDGNINYLPAAPITQTFTVTLGRPIIRTFANAASYKSQFAPGAYAVLFGSSFYSTETASDPPDLAVRIRDSRGNQFRAQLIYAGFGQVNLLLPSALATGAATLTVTNVAGDSNSIPFTLAAVAPALFSADGSGRGFAAAQALVVTANGDRQILPVVNCAPSLPCNGNSLPTAAGPLYLLLYGTGIRTGSQTTVTIGGLPAQVLFAGPQGEFPGLDQVNVQVPPSLSGVVEIRLTTDGINAPPVTIQLQ